MGHNVHAYVCGRLQDGKLVFICRSAPDVIGRRNRLFTGVRLNSISEIKIFESWIYKLVLQNVHTGPFLVVLLLWKACKHPWQLPAAWWDQGPSTLLEFREQHPGIALHPAQCRQITLMLWDKSSQAFPAGFAAEIPLPQLWHRGTPNLAAGINQGQFM